MKTRNNGARIAGALFVIAMFASLGGGLLISEATSLANGYTLSTGNRTALLAGILLELLNAVCVAGIAALLAPVLRRSSAATADWYLSIRTLEAVFCAVIVIAPLALFYFGGAHGDGTNAATQMLFAVRTGVSSVLIPIFFCLGAGALYASMFKTCIVPRFISAWGFIAALMVFTSNIVGFILPNGLNESVLMIFALPIILNELFLGGWLIVKGLKLNAEPSNYGKE